MSNKMVAGVCCSIALAATFAASCSLDVQGKGVFAEPGIGGGGASASSEASVSGSSGVGEATAGSGGSGVGGEGGATAASGTGGAGPGGGGQGGEMQPVCGNGTVEGTEGCDDGNTKQGDRCGSTCAVEDPTTCPGTPIKLGFETLVINDNTTGASDKVKESGNAEQCTHGDWSGGDFVYAVTPLQNGMLTATLKAQFQSHYLHTRTACPGVWQDEIGCDYATPAATPDVNKLAVVAGTTYYVFPDSHNKTAGAFELTLELKP